MMRNSTLKPLLFLVFCFVICQSFLATAEKVRVINERNNPIEGALIYCDNELIARSDRDGFFTTNVKLKSPFFLIVKARGYQFRYINTDEMPKEIKLDEEVSLKLHYFDVPLSSFEGATSSITGDKVTEIPVRIVTNAFTGRLPGLITVQTDGNPGYDAPDYYIRGRRTLAEGLMFIIDGQPGVARNIPASDIESVTVLKDATALALYGMRAANGAIVITTKRGQAGKMKINFSAQTAHQRFTRTYKRVRSATFASLYNEAMLNENPDAVPKYSEADIEKYRSGEDPIRYPDVDWYNESLRKGSWLQNYNVDISGGNEKTRYFVALGAQLQSGMYKTDDQFTYSTNNNYQRYNFRSNIDFQVTKTTFVGVNISMRYERRNYPGLAGMEMILLNSFLTTPTNAFPKYYVDDGTYVDNTGNAVVGIKGKIVSGSAQTGISNPWAMLNRAGYCIQDRRYGLININAKQKLDFIVKGLEFKVDVASDINSDQLIVRNKTYANYELMPDGRLFMRGKNENMNNSSTGSVNVRTTTLDFGLGYNLSLGEHELTTKVFYNLHESAYDDLIPTRYQGMGGLVFYSYDDRYGADFTFAYQGVNLLAPGNRYAFTPALALGWTISNERFMKTQKVISHLKLRSSIGQLANSRGIDYFAYMSAMTLEGKVMNQGTGTISSMDGYNETKIGNPNVTWEKSIQWDLGLDIGFLNNRLSLTGDYFQDHRRDMYMKPGAYSLIAGMPDIPKANIGKMKSSGFEISASWKDNIRDFSYSISGFYSRYNDKIIDFDEPVYEYDHMYRKGHSVDTNYGLIADGLFANQAQIDGAILPNFSDVRPGDIRYISQAGLPYIDTTYDVVKIGEGFVPKVFYAWEIGMSYKGFDCNVLFQGAAKVSRMVGGYMRNTFVGQGSFFDFQLDRWQNEDSGNTKYPRLTTSNNPNSNQPSTFWLRNGSYLRLKSVELGYSFLKPFKGKAGIDRIRVFLSGYNLAILKDKMKIADPEASGDGTGFPLPKVYNFGVTVSF